MIPSFLQSYIPFDRPASLGSKTTATRVETERREYRDWRSRIERVEWRSITYALHRTLREKPRHSCRGGIAERPGAFATCK